MLVNIKRINEKLYLDYFFLFVFLISLPISNVPAIQNYAFLFFALLLFFNTPKKEYKNIAKIKYFLLIFSSIIFVAFISVIFSIDRSETLSEIRGEILKPLFVLICIYLFTLNQSKKNFFYVSCIILICLLFHSLINLFMWYEGGFWPFRAGGLLDNGGGERFGIWATYSLAFSLGLLFTKYKKFSLILFFIFSLSLVANNTRATFVGMIFIFIFACLFFYKDRITKYLLILFILLGILIFIFYSKNFDTRYNLYNMINKTKYLDDYTPSKYNLLVKEHSLGASAVARLAMWKTVFLYRIQEPFVPLGYGRFLYNNQITDIWKNNPENIPVKLYSQAHNDFISILLSLGIFGLILFILFLSYNLKIAYYVFKNSEKYRPFAVFVFLGTVGYIASMMFGSFFGDSEQLYFYLLYGMLLAFYLKTKEENIEKTKIYQSK